jgi:FkbM family methyltransferase
VLGIKSRRHKQIASLLGRSMFVANWITLWKTPWETRYAIKYGKNGISSNDGDICISFIIYDFLKGKKNPVCLDIGADDCWWSIFCCQHYPTTQVDAFEPNKRPQEWIDTLRRDYPGIRLHNKAVSDKRGRLAFNLLGSDSHSRNDSTQTVECIPLDCLLDLYEYVDMIKIDTEGHEVQILTNILPYASKIDSILFECSVYWYDDIKEIAVSKIFNILTSYKKVYSYFYFVSRRGPPVLQDISNLDILFSILTSSFNERYQFDIFMTKKSFSIKTEFPPLESIQ